MQTSVQIIKEDTCKIIFRDWSFEQKVLLFVVQCRKPAITISCVSATNAIRYFQHDTWKQHFQKYSRAFLCTLFTSSSAGVMLSVLYILFKNAAAG
jgi:hypothetical protein